MSKFIRLRNRRTQPQRLQDDIVSLIDTTPTLYQQQSDPSLIPTNNNILYLLNHKTLTDFEVPILINNGYGVYIVKSFKNLEIKGHSIGINNGYYDNFLKLDTCIIQKLNNVHWFSNECVSAEIIDILNTHFKFIFLTLLTSADLLNQLINQYKGHIVFRFFGNGSTARYEPLLCNYKMSNKVKYVFCFPEIYEFEKTYTNFFNAQNSYIVRSGLSNVLINKIMNTYSPKDKKICFVVSYSNIHEYYKNVFLQFKKEFINYDYIILGRNNIDDANAFDNLDDDNYYKKMSECKLLYYHSKEPRHLHYHPFEAIVIGIPVIFYKESVLSSYLADSPGKCTDIDEAYRKINLILNDDKQFISELIIEQNKIIETMSVKYNNDIFKDILLLQNC